MKRNTRRRSHLLSVALLVLAVPVAAPAAPVERQPPAQPAGAEIARTEYFFSYRDGRLQAPNRAQGLRARLDEDGIEVVPREAEGSDRRLRLQLAEVARNGRTVAVASGVVAHDDERAEIRRRALTEWFVNRPEGLEHGVDLAAPPIEGAGELILRWRLGEGVAAIPAGPDGIVFRSAKGAPWLIYRNLLVLDATGAAVPARMQLASGALEIAIDDRDATYPLTVDPLLSNASWTVEGQQAGAFVGAASSTAGDVNGDGYSDIMVAAYGFDGGQTNEGRVWVYYGSPTGPSSPPAVLEANQAGAQFGFSIGAAGDVNDDGYDDLVVGANLHDTTLTNAGAVYLYLGSASGPQLKKVIEGTQGGAQFGRSVGTAGDVNSDGFDDIVATAHLFKNGQVDEGRAYVYHGTPSGVSDTPDWTAEGNQDGANFGTFAATAGDTNGDGYADVIVGAYLYDNGQVDEGAAFVYLGGPTGLSATEAWMDDGDWPGGRFGFSVATAGDVNADGYADIVVGAYLTDFSFNNEGAAFVYLGGSGGPSLGRHVSWYGGQDFANLGRSVFTAGDVNGDGFADVAVGANGYDTTAGGQGRVLVYHGSAAGLPTTADWIADGDGQASEFGKSVATAGDVNGDGYSDLMAGDPTYDNGQSNEGILRVYLGSAEGLSTARTTWAGSVNFEALGDAVATAGDVNGDGFSDAIAGKPGGPEFLAYYGSAAGLPATPSWTATNPPNASGSFGRSVASAGDVNGDGYDDVLVGDPNYTGDVLGEGRVALYLGSSSGLQPNAHRLYVGNDAQVAFGNSVASAGDVNGDGFADIVIGAPFYFSGNGGVFIYHGTTNGPDSSAPSTTLQGGFDARLGSSVAPAGDVDGDGYSDIIVCGSGERFAWVFPGSAAGIQSSPWRLEPGSIVGDNCFSVAAVGDANGDGYADVAYGDTTARRAWVFHGSASGPGPTPDATLSLSASPGSSFGTVASAGDTNNDGYSDLLVGAGTYQTSPGVGVGRAHLYLGSATGIQTTAAWTADGAMDDAGFGASLSTAGDANGDGFADVLVGERGWDGPGAIDAGRFHLYLGGGGDGMDRIPRQQRPGSTSQPPVALVGKSTDSDSFRLRTRARSAAGRIDVQVEYEVRPWATAFQSQGTHFSNEILTSPPAGDGTRLNFSSTIGGLAPDTVYKWRLRARSASPYFPWGPWLHLQGNGVGEWTIRTDCVSATWYRDADGDGFGDPNDTLTTCESNPIGYVMENSDCLDSDADVWHLPGEARDLVLSDDGVTTSLDWSDPLDLGGNVGSERHDVLRSATPDGFGSATCIGADLGHSNTTDPDVPAVGALFHYLPRTTNACGVGTLGFDSDGVERSGVACP